METKKYTTVAIILHWLIAVLILGQIAGGLYMSSLPGGSPEKFDLFQLHKSFGLSILFLSLLRLAWRLLHRPPPLPETMKGSEKVAARLSHIGFYGLMIGVPLIGWALASASPFAASVPTYIFGVVPWPHLPFFEGIEDRAALAQRIAEIHKFFALSILALLVLHVGAALKHHFSDKDDVLSRMLPMLKSNAGRN